MGDEESSVQPVGMKEVPLEELLACLEKVNCWPGSDMEHVDAIRGLAAIGKGIPPGASKEPKSMLLVELEGLLRRAGDALLDRAGLLAGERERGEVCDALQYLSFRCFCAVEILYRISSGEPLDVCPTGEAIWGPILEAWGSVDVEAGSLEGALADLTRWWLKRKREPAPSAAEVARSAHDSDADAAVEAALSSMRELAEYLGEADEEDLGSKNARTKLHEAADAVTKMRQQLRCTRLVAARTLAPTDGLDVGEEIAFFSSADRSVYSVSKDIMPEYFTEVQDVEEWTWGIASGASNLEETVGPVLATESMRVAQGFPRAVQALLGVGLVHSSTQLSPTDPLGLVSGVNIQVHCERGWPLGMFVRDEGWPSLDLRLRKQLCVKLLGTCAVAAASDAKLNRFTLESFVVVGVQECTLEALEDALIFGRCQVLIGSCVGVWARAGNGSAASTIRSMLEQILGPFEAGGSVKRWIQQLTARYSSGASASGAESTGGSHPSRFLTAYVNACKSVDVFSDCLRGADGRILAVKAAEQERELIRTKLELQEQKENTASFIRACKKGEIGLVRHFLELSGSRVVDVHAPDTGGPEAGFRAACQNGHIDVVRELLALTGDREVDVHAARWGNPEFGFQYACRNGHIEVVRELLSLRGHREVDVHAYSEHAFQLACSNGSLEVLRLLLALEGEREVNVGTNCYLGFRWACQAGHIDVVRELLALTGHREVDVHAGPEGEPEAGFRAACERGHIGVVLELLALTGDREVDVHAGDESGPEAGFRLACQNGHVGVVRELLALTGHREVDVHCGCKGEPEAGFRAACAHGHVEVVRELLALTGDREVNVHAGLGGLPEIGFCLACEHGRVAVVRELLALSGDRAVDVHAGMDGRQEYGFLLACQNGHTDVVRELLALTGDREVDVHAGAGSDPEAGFWVACKGGHVDVVRELLALTGHRAVDVHAGPEGSPEAGFRAACKAGHVVVVRELLALTGDREVDVHAGPEGDSEAGFRAACQFGQVDVVRELLALTGDREVDVHVDGGYGFRAACHFGHVDVVRELLGLTGTRRIPSEMRHAARKFAELEELI